MTEIRADIPDRLKDEVADRADYADTRVSDVVRNALQIYLELENPEEIINESDSE